MMSQSDVQRNPGAEDNPDPRLLGYFKVTKADAEGRFRFDRLAGGDYFVGTYVNRGVPPGSGSVAEQSCYDQVTVSDGQEARVTLSGN